jgi:formate hydrogenlyase transcriptional activator
MILTGTCGYLLKHLTQIIMDVMQFEMEKVYLKDGIETNSRYPEIIGESEAVHQMLRLVSRVAPSDSTVLILGETGTGKELVARAIHYNSSRRAKSMVKVNCATLPANLIESELFGHERGSFTGATERRIGKFELAHNSTIFLDEVGELPLDLQVKLLRVLQEREIERIGGRVTMRVDVRIIAATNRDLEKEVDEGRFRADLYYRLNIFPINLPSLRDRRDDIALLAAHFIQKLSKKTGRKITMISKSVLEQITRYDWPGNIRELEHVIERSIVLCDDDIIKQIYLPCRKEHALNRSSENKFIIKTIEENERDHILNMLKHTQGRVGGYKGAAEFLGVPPSTLSSKLKRLGIKREHY